MDLSALDTDNVHLGLALYLVVCLVCLWLLSRKRYVILLLWPVLIYFPGPTLTSLFESAPALGQYIFTDLTLFETVVIFCYFIGLVLADALLDLSGIIEASLFNPTVRSLTASPLFLPLYFATAALAIVLQINILRTYGTVLTGNYAYWASLADENTGWGFIAGLYEIIFLCFVLMLLGGEGLSRASRAMVTVVYAITAVLRLAGGTRLVLVKELALVLLLLYLHGRIRKRNLAIATMLIVAAGSGVGLMRSSGGAAAGELLGPVYGLVIESALNALSFNIAYQVQVAGAIDTWQQLAQALPYLLISSVPSFLRGGMTTKDLDDMSPYNLGLGSGFDTTSPVGGMSGFATLTYLSGNVMLACWLVVLGIAVLMRFTPRSRWKRLAVLVFVINAIHFWRDAMDISIKLFVQDLLIVLLLLYVPRVSQWRVPRLAAADASP